MQYVADATGDDEISVSLPRGSLHDIITHIPVTSIAVQAMNNDWVPLTQCKMCRKITKRHVNAYVWKKFEYV